MSKSEQVYISDCTLLEASSRFDLSFREKILLCSLIDKLGVSSIDLCRINQKKIDSLLIKSISSAVQNAKVAVPVQLNDEESIQNTWAALNEAKFPRLQVIAPVSSVQMEYLLHLKPQAVLSAVQNTIQQCKKYSADVEFIAEDATRSDLPFLIQVLSAAVAGGAETITLCDTAGVMMPEEISSWLQCILEGVPELKQKTIGFFSSGELNMADACALSAIKTGVRMIKTISCRGTAISLANIIRILSAKGGLLGVHTLVGTEQIRKITGQVEKICQAAGQKTILLDENVANHDEDIYLSEHDSLETVMNAASKLGYDLNSEDQEKVWKCFIQTAERKERLSLKELDAIIATEAMQVPPAFHDIKYVINTGNQIGAMAHMKLMFHDKEIEGIASGDGAIDAAFNSIEKATGRHFELDSFQIQAITEGREAMGETIVRIRWEGKLYSGRGISTDIVGAGIMAYINAVNKIVYEEEEI